MGSIGMPHPRKENHQFFVVRPDMRIIMDIHPKGFLFFKHPGRITRSRLAEAKDKIARGHKINREYVKLNTDPEHQRNSEHPAQNHTGFFLPAEGRPQSGWSGRLQ